MTRSRFAKAVATQAATKPRIPLLVGTVQGIEERVGQSRIYIIEGRPMPLLANGESASIVRGSQVVYLDTDPPLALGMIVSD